MRRAARIDANQNEIVKALRQVGASVQSLASTGKGCPDLLVGFRGTNYLMEIKDGQKFKSDRKLAPDQIEWHESWRGKVFVVESIDQAISLISNNQGDGMKSKVDVDALKLTLQWQGFFLKGWFEDHWCDLKDYAEASLKLLLIILRILFSPILIIYVIWQTRKMYEQIASGEVNREKVRNHIKKYGK